MSRSSNFGCSERFINHLYKLNYILAEVILNNVGKLSTQLLNLHYDVHHTAEVYLRDTTVTYLNKLMKRDKSMQKE